MKEIAIFFPGIGYGNDKPLLHYSQKLFKERNIEILKVEWNDFPPDSKKNKDFLEEAVKLSLSQTEEKFKSFDFSGYSKVYLIGKSIGTVSCTFMNEKFFKISDIETKLILFTPVEMTFDYLDADDDALIFHGTKDPWLSEEIFDQNIFETKAESVIIENANHSLETEDTLQDIQTVFYVIETLKDSLFTDIE